RPRSAQSRAYRSTHPDRIVEINPRPAQRPRRIRPFGSSRILITPKVAPFRIDVEIPRFAPVEIQTEIQDGNTRRRYKTDSVRCFIMALARMSLARMPCAMINVSVTVTTCDQSRRYYARPLHLSGDLH